MPNYSKRAIVFRRHPGDADPEYVEHMLAREKHATMKWLYCACDDGQIYAICISPPRLIDSTDTALIYQIDCRCERIRTFDVALLPPPPPSDTVWWRPPAPREKAPPPKPPLWDRVKAYFKREWEITKRDLEQ